MVWLCALPAAAEPTWSLELNGRTYAYSLTVTSALPPEAILDILFDFAHVKVFSRAGGAAHLLRQQGAVNEIRFDKRQLFYHCSSVFRRTLDREGGTLSIELIQFTANWAGTIPQAVSSRGRYTVIDRGDHREVRFRQDVETDRPVGGLSLRMLRGSLGQFARDLDMHLRQPRPSAPAGPM
jgi:hypothetical protein